MCAGYLRIIMSNHRKPFTLSIKTPIRNGEDDLIFHSILENGQLWARASCVRGQRGSFKSVWDSPFRLPIRWCAWSFIFVVMVLQRHRAVPFCAPKFLLQLAVSFLRDRARVTVTFLCHVTGQSKLRAGCPLVLLDLPQQNKGADESMSCYEGSIPASVTSHVVQKTLRIYYACVTILIALSMIVASRNGGDQSQVLIMLTFLWTKNKEEGTISRLEH